MSLLFYLLVTGLPAAWIAQGSSGAPWKRLAGPPKLWQLLAVYGALFVLVWSCALGLLPLIDSVVFARRDLEMSAPAFWGYHHFERFLYDDVTALALTLAVLSWWNREVRGLPRWFPRALALGTYWLLLEETDYRPFSVLLAPEALQRASFHHEFRALNMASYLTLLGGLAAYVALRALLRSPESPPPEEERSSALTELLHWIRGIRPIHPIAVSLGMASSFVLSSHFSDVLGASFTTEEDKYWDFGHSIVYLAWLFISLDHPLRTVRRRALLSPIVVFAGVAAICIIKSL